MYRYKYSSPSPIKHYVNQPTIHLEENEKQITLQEALDSEYPVYTKANPIFIKIPQGVKNINDDKNFVKLGGTRFKTNIDFYLLNMLYKTLKLIKAGDTF